MTNGTYNFNDKFVKSNQDSFDQLIHLLKLMLSAVQRGRCQYQKAKSRKVYQRLQHLIGSYAADFCKYSKYYQPSLFTYPLKDQVYKNKWMRESMAIEIAPDKHTKSVLEQNYRTLPGDSAIVFYTGDIDLNNGSMIFMHPITAEEFINAVKTALQQLENHDF